MAKNEIDIEKVVLILRARARLIISILAVSIILAATITLMSPKMYRSTSSLNFEFSTNPVDTRGRLLSDSTYITTQIDIIESQSVAQEVVGSLTDYEKSRLVKALDARFTVVDNLVRKIKSSINSFSKGQKNNSASVEDGGNRETLGVSSAYGSLARTMGIGLEISPMINSRIVRISYLSTDRRIAALIANKYAEAYIATSLRMITDPAQKSKVWFDEQLKSLRKRLEDTQEVLTAYQQQEGIVSSDGRLDFATQRMQDLAGQLVDVQQATRNAVTKKNKLQEVIDSEESLMTFPAVFDNPVVQNIKAEIRNLKGAIAKKSSSLGRNHPEMKKLNSELYSARQRLDTEVEAIIDGINNAADLSRQREIDLEAALKEQKALVLSLKNEHDKIAVLKRDVESAQATYNAALNQLNTTSMQSLVDQTNVSIIDGANIPSTHATPRVMMNLALGVFGGLLLGVGLALFMELIVRRVHTKEELVSGLNIPLLGHLKNA